MAQAAGKRLSLSQTEELQILRRIVDLTTSDLDLNWILNEGRKIVNEVPLADSVFIFLFDGRKQNLILMASKIPHPRMLGKINLRIGEGITGWVAKENKPVAIRKNASQDPRMRDL